jgi:hypothetical protein
LWDTESKLLKAHKPGAVLGKLGRMESLQNFDEEKENKKRWYQYLCNDVEWRLGADLTGNVA